MLCFRLRRPFLPSTATAPRPDGRRVNAQRAGQCLAICLHRVFAKKQRKPENPRGSPLHKKPEHAPQRTGGHIRALACNHFFLYLLYNQVAEGIVSRFCPLHAHLKPFVIRRLDIIYSEFCYRSAPKKHAGGGGLFRTFNIQPPPTHFFGSSHRAPQWLLTRARWVHPVGKVPLPTARLFTAQAL